MKPARVHKGMKLSDTQVQAVRQMQGQASHRVIAARFGVSCPEHAKQLTLPVFEGK